MGMACSIKGRRKGMHIGYWWESCKEKRPLRRPRHHWADIKINH
jgi:hypothetical protein